MYIFKRIFLFEGGANGVAAINTISGLMNLKADTTPWPSVGIEKRTTYGGVSGNATRPVALRAVSDIKRKIPDLEVMGKTLYYKWKERWFFHFFLINIGIGGVDSADVALQFLHCGATVLQVGSAIQNQDFTLIDDYCTGLKALLYLYNRLPNWDGQSPPTIKHQLGKPVISLYDTNGKVSFQNCIKMHVLTLFFKKLPHFGPYKKQREQQIEKMNLEKGPLAITEIENVANKNGVETEQIAIPKINEIVGKALEKIGAYNSLDNKKQVVALIDDVSPILFYKYNIVCLMITNFRICV